MELRSGGGVVFSCCSGGGGGGSVRTAPPGGSGGGGGHTTDLVSGESYSASLALILGARVPMGRPRGWI
jgi:hypothetical protein